MKRIHLLLIALQLLSSLAAFAEGGDTVVEMSAYNPCESGGDQTKFSRMKPSEYSLDKNPEVTVIAIPKKAGETDLKGKCFRAVGGYGDDKASQKMVDALSKRTFVAADECPACSNQAGKVRVDVATSCTSKLNRNMLIKSVHLKEVQCPLKIYQALNKKVRRDQFAENYGAASGAGR